jgi:DNA topoisomerase I
LDRLCQFYVDQTLAARSLPDTTVPETAAKSAPRPTVRVRADRHDVCYCAILAADALLNVSEASSERGAKKQIVAAVQIVAERLGNTVSVCRKCYIHPAVIESYREGTLARQRSSRASAVSGLRSVEMALVAMLKARARKAKRPDRPEHSLRDSLQKLAGSRRRKTRTAG